MATVLDTFLDFEAILAKKLNSTELTNPTMVFDTFLEKAEPIFVREVLWKLWEELRQLSHVSYLKKAKTDSISAILRQTSSNLLMNSRPSPECSRRIFRNELAIAILLNNILTNEPDHLPVEHKVALRLREIIRELEKCSPVKT